MQQKTQHRKTKIRYNTNNRVCCVRNELYRLDLNNLWYSQHSVRKKHMLVIKQRLFDISKQEFYAI